MKKSYYVKKDWHNSTDAKHRLAVNGEDFTANYIEQQGMKIIGRNVRYRMGELDIIALDRDCICFIEVKTRSNLNYGSPAMSVTKKKQHTLTVLAQIFLMFHQQYSSYYIRFDVAEVMYTEGNYHMHYIDAAF